MNWLSVVVASATLVSSKIIVLQSYSHQLIIMATSLKKMLTLGGNFNASPGEIDVASLFVSQWVLLSVLLKEVWPLNLSVLLKGVWPLFLSVLLNKVWPLYQAVPVKGWHLHQSTLLKEAWHLSVSFGKAGVASVPVSLTDRWCVLCTCHFQLFFIYSFIYLLIFLIRNLTLCHCCVMYWSSCELNTWLLYSHNLKLKKKSHLWSQQAC